MSRSNSRSIQRSAALLETKLRTEFRRVVELRCKARKPDDVLFYEHTLLCLALLDYFGRALIRSLQARVSKLESAEEQSLAALAESRARLRSHSRAARGLALRDDQAARASDAPHGEDSELDRLRRSLSEFSAYVRKQSAEIAPILESGTEYQEAVHRRLAGMTRHVAHEGLRRLNVLSTRIDSRNARARSKVVRELGIAFAEAKLDSKVALVTKVFELLPELLSPEGRQEAEIDKGNEAWLARNRELEPYYQWCLVTQVTLLIEAESQAQIDATEGSMTALSELLEDTLREEKEVERAKRRLELASQEVLDVSRAWMTRRIQEAGAPATREQVSAEVERRAQSN